jgi:hypothetical protein
MDLAALEVALRDLSHDESAVQLVRSFAQGLGKTKQRQQLLKFQSTQRLYLPPLPQDPPDTLANAVLFDGIIQIELERLLLATRIGSLSLVGWRIFGSIIRSLLARTGDGEVRLRG